MPHWVAVFFFFLMQHSVHAVLPDEVLSDPVLEARARALSLKLRCVVCENQTIDDSNAGMARDVRLFIREKISKGSQDQEVIDFLVERYGEFILMMPEFNGSHLFLWGTPFLILFCSILYVSLHVFGLSFFRKIQDKKE